MEQKINNLFLEPISRIHRLNLVTKIIVFLMIIPGIVFITKARFLMIPFIFVLIIVLLSKIDLNIFWHSCKFYIFFFALGTIIFSLAFANGDFTDRLIAGIIWGIRFDIVIFTSIFLILITDPIEIPLTLSQIGLPHRIGVTLMVAIRMIPLIRKGILNVIQAQKARGLNWSLNITNVFNLPVRLISLVIPCVFITLETSVSLTDTLLSRGYDPYGIITKRPQNWSWFDLIVFIFAVLILFFIIFIPKIYS